MSHLVRIPVRFGEVDSAQIVYFPNLLHYCHVAMEETFREAIGTPYPTLFREERLGFPAVKLETEFASPAAYGDVVEVAVSVPRVGKTSTVFRFEARRASDAKPLFSATVTTVCVDMDTFKPVEVPARYRTAFARLSS